MYQFHAYILKKWVHQNEVEMLNLICLLYLDIFYVPINFNDQVGVIFINYKINKSPKRTAHQLSADVTCIFSVHIYIFQGV